MGRLVGDLITLAKTGRPDFVTPAVVELDELTVECFDKARALADRRWVLEQVADAPVVVDAQRLTQAWLQLAENAAKYSAAGSVVEMGSSVDGGEIRLWVRDEGVGIPAEDLGRIFERFARSNTARGAEGSGLGLTIARAIVEAHGGRVEVASVVGEGSTFTLVVPTGVPEGEAQHRVAVHAGEEQ
jgi:signal transduction histidine kinase